LADGVGELDEHEADGEADEPLDHRPRLARAAQACGGKISAIRSQKIGPRPKAEGDDVRQPGDERESDCPGTERQLEREPGQDQ
jgi:hypothetical protein